MESKVSTVASDKRIIAPHSQEVEFALLLSKMIKTVKEDPEQLRLTIYDFARTKLRQDLSWATEEERSHLLGALETAIVGVEQFSQRPEPPRLPSIRILADGSAAGVQAVDSALRWIDPEPAQGFSDQGLLDQGFPDQGLSNRGFSSWGVDARFGSSSTVRAKRAWLAPVLTVLLVLAVATVLVGGAFVFYGHRRQLAIANQVAAGKTLHADGGPNAPAPDAKPAEAVAEPPTQLGFPIPSVYGVYALNKGKLSELDALAVQVPDRRVAVSTPITDPSRSVLPDGHVAFIIYRRDIAASAPEKVDIRVVATVTRDISFDAKGERSIKPVKDAWNIRNISRVFRVRPIAGHPEMILVQAEDPSVALPAGRYALDLQGQAYDFMVAGRVTDVAHCLERTEAANGVFYSECQAIKPP